MLVWQMVGEPGFHVSNRSEVEQAFAELVKLIGGQDVQALYQFGRDYAKTFAHLADDKSFFPFMSLLSSETK
jgi:hypothetical protein